MILQLSYKQVILQDSLKNRFVCRVWWILKVRVAYRIYFWGGGDRICLRSRISDINLARLTIGGPELASVDFKEYSCNG